MVNFKSLLPLSYSIRKQDFEIWKVKRKSFAGLFFNRVDTIYHRGLRSRELGQAPMLLVFLIPKQALSSHPVVFIMIFVGVHEFSSRLTTFSSCRLRGSNR